MFEEISFAKFNGNPPVTQEEMSNFKSSSNIALPRDYERFLQVMNGGEGFIGDQYLILYKLERLIATNGNYNLRNSFQATSCSARTVGAQDSRSVPDRSMV